MASFLSTIPADLKLTKVLYTLDNDTKWRICGVITPMDKSPRLAAILPLKITVGNDSHAQFAHTLDISSSGVRVILPLAPDPGCSILLEHKKKRARAVVVWSRPIKKSRTDYEVGMRLLDDGQRFWLVDFAPNAHVLEFTGQSDEKLGHRNKDS